MSGFDSIGGGQRVSERESVIKFEFASVQFEINQSHTFSNSTCCTASSLLGNKIQKTIACLTLSAQTFGFESFNLASNLSIESYIDFSVIIVPNLLEQAL